MKSQSSQTHLPVKLQILNISMNLARIGGWVADNYPQKKPLVERFLSQTDQYLNDLNNQDLSENFLPTLNRFKQEFIKLKSNLPNEKSKLIWAEHALTWANIFQHRAALL